MTQLVAQNISVRIGKKDIVKDVTLRVDHQQFVGEVLERNDDYIKIEVKNRFVVGDSMELMTTSGNITFILYEILDKNRQPIIDAKGSGYIVEIPIPADIDMQYALLIRNLPNSTADISASSLAYQAV